MWPGSALSWVPFGWIVLVGAAVPADEARNPRAAAIMTENERTYHTDFCTLIDCLRKVASDHGLATKYSGSGSWLDSGRWSVQGEGGFLLVADPKKYPFFAEDPMRSFGHFGPRGEANRRDLRRIIVDLDSGELRGPDGFGMKGLRMRSLYVRFSLTKKGVQEICKIELSRNYSSKGITISISSKGMDRQEFFRGFLQSLESRLKLAKRLQDIRRQNPEKRQKGKKGTCRINAERKKGTYRITACNHQRLQAGRRDHGPFGAVVAESRGPPAESGGAETLTMNPETEPTDPQPSSCVTTVTYSCDDAGRPTGVGVSEPASPVREPEPRPQPAAAPFQWEHDRDQGLFRITGPQGRVEAFRDKPVRHLVVEPDPQTGAWRPILTRGRPTYLYLAREEQEVR